MSQPRIEILGYEVVEADGEKVKRLSGRFIIRGAAEEMVDLLKKNGHPNCYINECLGTEGVRGYKRKLARSVAL